MGNEIHNAMDAVRTEAVVSRRNQCLYSTMCLFILVYLFLPNIMCLLYILMTVFVGCTLYADDIELLSTP